MILIDFSDQLIQELIDYVIENYKEIEGVCPNTSRQANRPECVRCNHDNYYDGTPFYDCENFRKVYLIRYLASHTKQTYDIINGTTIRDIAKRTTLSAVSLGGGPGVEVFALLAQLKKHRWKNHIVFHNIDKENSWESMYMDLSQFFSKLVKNIDIKLRFQKHDVTRGGLDLECSMVFVPWILSEVDTSKRRSVLVNSRDLARTKGYVVVTDRPEPDLVEAISETIDRIKGWHLLDHEGEYGEYCGIQFPDEIRDDFWVQLSYNTAYWILKKS